jgi:hypothetical protein
VPLNGPWKFHTGDNPLWAEPNFDDSTWETFDLTPPPGAHDDDVGLTGYVPGWQARSHRGYFGYAWYRIHVAVVAAPQGEGLALCGPDNVDSAYQIFLNGRLLGSVGDFSHPTPVAYGIHHPTMFPLPQSLASSENEGSAVVALRVWMGPWALGNPEAGGIHNAPALGTTPGIEARYQLQWLETIRGYIVDAVEALLFVLLAVMVCSFITFDHSTSAYLWLAASLIFVGLIRANQALFFWWQFESVQGFELFTIVLFVPLSLAASMLAWRAWFPLRDTAWVPPLVGILAAVHMGSQFLNRSWFYGTFPHWVGVATRFCATYVRWVYLLLMLFIIFRVISQRSRERWFALPAILLISVGLFAAELSTMHVKGIWFPFGTGVSRTEYAYAAFDVVFVVLLWRRLRFLAQRQTTDPLTHAAGAEQT